MRGGCILSILHIVSGGLTRLLSLGANGTSGLGTGLGLFALGTEKGGESWKKTDLPKSIKRKEAETPELAPGGLVCPPVKEGAGDLGVAFAAGASQY